ncbi:WD repeat-containing protein 43 [Hordeum vulgare]|nr:WD repeat-containing protein 43 [Hordeum vulgare]
MPREQEDDNKGEEDNMKEEDSMEEEEREIKDLKRKTVFEGDSEREDLFCEAEEEEEEGFVEPAPMKKLPIKRGPTTRSHCSSEDILEEDYVPLSDDGNYGEVDSDDEVVLYCSLSGRKPRSKKKKGKIWKLQLEHTCAPSGENCKIPARYVAKAVEDSFRTYPRGGIDTMIDKTKEKFGVEIGYELYFCHEGLLNAIDQIFPNFPQKYCLRDIYANLQSLGFRGDELEKYMDATSYSYTKNGFDLAM